MKFIKHTNKELLDHFGLTNKNINHIDRVDKPTYNDGFQDASFASNPHKLVMVHLYLDNHPSDRVYYADILMENFL